MSGMCLCSYTLALFSGRNLELGFRISKSLKETERFGEMEAKNGREKGINDNLFSGRNVKESWNTKRIINVKEMKIDAGLSNVIKRQNRQREGEREIEKEER